MLKFDSQIASREGHRGPVGQGAGPQYETRSFHAKELRAETEGDKRYLSGYAATYNTLSDDLGWGMRERIIPGAFKRAVKDKQDVKHLINHDPNLVLGRTKSNTLELGEDKKGLKFRTELPATSFASDLFVSVERGDVDECSFGFQALKVAWIEESDPDFPDDPKHMRCIRELHDLMLFDVSTVTYPAYPGTLTQAERTRLMHEAPVELRSKIMAQRDYSDDDCQCQCMSCLDGECEDCTGDDCDDENCRDCPMQSSRSRRRPGARRDKAKTKRVDGEDLTSECFLIVGDKDDVSKWKLPWKFSTDAKIEDHLQNDLVRFNTFKGASKEAKDAAWTKLVKLCKEHNIDVSEEKSSNIRQALTPTQIEDLEFDLEVWTRKARLRQIEAASEPVAAT